MMLISSMSINEIVLSTFSFRSDTINAFPFIHTPYIRPFHLALIGYHNGMHGKKFH